MKKSYTKPEIIVEEFTMNQVLCSCIVENKLQSEYEQCAFYLEGLGLYLFADSWDSCNMDPATLDLDGYCYHPGTNNVFSS